MASKIATFPSRDSVFPHHRHPLRQEGSQAGGLGGELGRPGNCEQRGAGEMSGNVSLDLLPRKI